MYRIATVIFLLSMFFFCALPIPRALAQDSKGKETKDKSAPPVAPAPAPAESPKPAPSSAVTPESLDGDLKRAVGLLLAVFVVGTALVWIVMAAKISNRASTNDLQALATTQQLQPLATTVQLQPLATTAQLQPLATAAQLQPLATTAQLQVIATTQQVRDAEAALETKVDALRADITRLSQDLGLIKGSNDSVLNLIGRLVPGLPPQIVSLVPSTGAVGAGVVILGNNFLNGCRVWFGTAEIQPTEVTDTAIRLTVPAGARGHVNVYVQGQNGVSTPLRFTVT
jgi:hypothetical protein